MEEQSDRKREHRKNSSDEERKQPRVEGARNNTQSQPSTSQGTRVVAGSNQRQGAMKKNHRRKNFTPVRKRRPEISGLTGSGNLQQPFQCYDPEEQQEAEGATAGPMPKSPRNAAPKFTPFGESLLYTFCLFVLCCFQRIRFVTSVFSCPDYCGNHNPPHFDYTECQAGDGYQC